MRVRLAVLTGMALLASTVPLAAGAAAGVAPGTGRPGAATAAIALERVAAVSLNTSANKSITADCPAGTQVVGTGGRIVGGLGEVLITDIIPNAALTSVTVWGGENGLFTGSWEVVAIAMCSSDITDLVRVSATSSDNGTSLSPKGALASCPAGDILFGMGYRLSGANGNVFPSELTPLGAPPDQVAVGAYEDLAFAPNWDLTVYGICGFTTGTVSVAQAQSALDSTSPKPALVGCPAGTQVTSAGGNNGGAATGIADDLILDRMAPEPGLTASTTTVVENLGVGTSWLATAYAICVS
jgi:hypothetical protein